MGKERSSNKAKESQRGMGKGRERTEHGVWLSRNRREMTSEEQERHECGCTEGAAKSPVRQGNKLMQGLRWAW